MHYLKLIRTPNLIILALAQYIFKYYFIYYYYPMTGLSDFEFFLLVFSTVCIAAGGYVINDIMDIDTDTINKPEKVIIDTHISEKKATTLFIVLNIIGVGLGFYLSYMTNLPKFAMLFVFSSGILYLYANNLKNYIVLSNIIVAFLIAISILLVGIFSILPLYTNYIYAELNKVMFTKLLIYAGLAFAINFIREIVKDIEDIDGDYNSGRNTIPIALGIKRTGILTGILALLLFGVIGYITFNHLYSSQITSYYVFFLIMIPLLYVAISSFIAKKKSNFKPLQLILKGVMLTGIFAVVIIYKFILT
ncbi:prenyltransferase [Neptunitalea chrysea]|uniref:Prenyltransferase n=1 Tax=Neptunitalea chrysea TaxID=1647581 RepID=A0A9W6EVD0_9FLAO|nr:geranylgeranylglycerol-phosphate geranylgeranyltransferase [Neptunitalea chrysea]GLB51383.1 prenyltransferase [Neptunitalea chrysea]